MPLRNALQELVLHGFPGWSVSIPVIVMGVNLEYTFNGEGSVVAVYLSRSSSVVKFQTKIEPGEIMSVFSIGKSFLQFFLVIVCVRQSYLYEQLDHVVRDNGLCSMLLHFFLDPPITIISGTPGAWPQKRWMCSRVGCCLYFPR